MTFTHVLLLLSLAFGEGLPCRIMGSLYTNPQDQPSLTRTDGCKFVSDAIQEELLVLTSPHFRVEVPLPSMGGHQAFWYVWGAEQAHVRGMDWPIRWTRVVTG